MNRPSFLSAVMTALWLAVAAGVAFAALAPLLPVAAALRLLISGLGLAYLVWLMRGGRRRGGRATAIVAWLLLSGASWFAAPGLAACLSMHAALIWLIRSFLYYRGVLPALMDLAVCAFGVAAAVWVAGHTGSVFLAAWCFFLGQALFVAIPAGIPRRSQRRHGTPRADDAFEQARRRADAAFRQLVARDGR